MKALDLSFSAASAAWCRARKAEGWELLVANLWTGVATPAPAQANLAAARAAGMLVAGYTVTNLMPGAATVDKAKTAAGAEWEHLRFLAIDVEVSGVPVDVMIRHVREALARTRELGKRACIYTARWFWTAHMANTTVFKDVPLWNAHYDSDPDIDFPRASYGGFSQVIGEQYQGTTDLAGVQVDLNTFDRAFVTEQEEEDEDMPLSDVDIDRIITRMVKTNVIRQEVGRELIAQGGKIRDWAAEGVKKSKDAIKDAVKQAQREGTG